jgi:hypothetical protein
VEPDELEAAREFGARLAPCLFPERRRDRIAVEHRKNERTERVELHVSVDAMRAQHALDQFRHHREPERIGPPTRSLHRRLESRFAKQDLGIMSRPRAGVLVDAFLHQESGVLVDEIGQPLRIANRRTGTEKPKKPQQSLQDRAAVRIFGRTGRCHDNLFKS